MKIMTTLAAAHLLVFNQNDYGTSIITRARAAGCGS